ncbi:MAG: hypothetical protein RIS45_369, partial [Planctomycetota bacterium]
ATVSKDYELGEAQNAIRAAKALGAKLGWSGEMVLGSTKDGYVAVFASGDRFVLGGSNMAGGRRRTAHRAGTKRTAKRSANRAGKLKRYRIVSSDGADLGIYRASSERAALDAMARRAGYRSQAEAARVAGPFRGYVTEI